MGGFQGMGFNVSYFAQYALPYIPLVVLALIESESACTRGAAVFGLLVTAYTIPATRQRAAYILLGLELAALLAAWAIWWRRTRSERATVLAAPVGRPRPRGERRYAPFRRADEGTLLALIHPPVRKS